MDIEIQLHYRLRAKLREVAVRYERERFDVRARSLFLQDCTNALLEQISDEPGAVFEIVDRESSASARAEEKQRLKEIVRDIRRSADWSFHDNTPGSRIDAQDVAIITDKLIDLCGRLVEAL